MSSGVIPDNLLLPQAAPMAIKAYRRRFESPSTNVASAGPDEYVSIYPDTSTPGAFIDPSSTYLRFDLEITNDNFMIDYQNFGVEGAASLIQDLRIYNQGSILEEIMEYGTVASLMANIEGAYQQEVSMYFSNKLKNGYHEENHINFIKPPMCDGTGNIMHGLNPFGLGYEPGAYSSTSVYANAVGTNIMNGWIQTNSHMAVTDSYNVSPVGSTKNPSYAAGGAQWAGRSAVTAPTNAPQTTTPMDWPDYYTPSQSEIVKRDFVMEYGTINKPQVMSNFVNVKCFPIGMQPGDDCYSTGSKYGVAPKVVYGATPGNAPGKQTYAPVRKSSKVRVCMQLYSGILGKLAPKMLASTLLGPQQLYLNLHLASVPVALRISSDPCRRISGTIRDYIRNVGTKNGCYFGENLFVYGATVAGNSIAANPQTTTFAPGYGPYRKIAMSQGTGFSANTPGSVFNKSQCVGNIFLGGSSQESVVLAGANAVSVNTTTGEITFTTTAQPNLLPGMTFTITEDATNFYTGVITSRNAANLVFQSEGSGVGTPSGNIGTVDAAAMKPTDDYSLGPAPQYMLVKNPWVYKKMGLAQTTGARLNYANDTDVFYGTREIASVPQVKRVLHFNSVSGGFSSATSTDSVMPAWDGSNLTYSISSIALVGDQIILPNEVTADVVSQAASGQFNVHSNSIRTYVVAPQAGTVQSMILPIKVAQAKQLFCVFQNTQQRNYGSGLYYDSNCGYNPFASISKPSTAKNVNYDGFGETNATDSTEGSTAASKKLFGVGFDSPLTYTPVTTAVDAISMQLRIGNEFYPPQPITSMVECSTEFVKTLHGWTDIGFSPEVDAPISQTLSAGSTLGELGTAPTSEAPPIYDCLRANKYCTAFVNANLLDDQTILQNQDMVPLYSTFLSTAPKPAVDPATNGVTTCYNGYNYLCPRGYCLNGVYEVPCGRFVMGFNLSTFKPSDGVDGGTYLGNNTITLQMSGAAGLDPINGIWRMVCVVPHRVLMRYQAGGQIVWNY